MDGTGIKTALSVSKGPSPLMRAQQKQLVHVAFETRMGVMYTFADMMPHHFESLMADLGGSSERVIARNVSGVVLVLPRHILSKLWLLEADEDWKTHETGLHARRSELWANSM